MERFKLGKLDPEVPVGLQYIHHYQQEALAPAPEAISLPMVASWPMALNDTYGDCELASTIHCQQTFATLTSTPWTYVGDIATKTEYFTETGGKDSGLVIAKTLTRWATRGIFDNKLGAHAPFEANNVGQFKQWIYLGGAVQIGVRLPVIAQTQFGNNQPFHLTHTSADYNIEGGHAICGVAYNPSGAYVVTWGKAQFATWEWLTTYADEAWALLDQDIIDRGQFRGINIAQLQSDFQGRGA